MSNSETITIRVSKEDKEIISHYAKVHGVSTSELMKMAAIEKIEDEIDLETYKEAMKAYKKDDTTYSLDEAERLLGL